MSVSDESLITVGLLQDLDNLVSNYKRAQEAYIDNLEGTRPDRNSAKTQRDNMTQIAAAIVSLTSQIKPRLTGSDTRVATYMNLSNDNDDDLSASVDSVAKEYAAIQAKMAEENQYLGKDETSGLVVKSSAYKYVTYVLLTLVMVILAFFSITSESTNTGPLLALFLIGMAFIIYQYWFSITTTVSLTTESWMDKLDMQIRWLLQAV